MSALSGSDLCIQTPEGIAFSFPLAGPVTRFLAWVIDVCCISVASSATGILIALAGLLTLDAGRAAGIIGYFVVSIGYGVALEWLWRGQTIGKRLLSLRVIDERGMRLQFNQVLLRNLLRFFDTLPAFYLVGGVACFLSPRRQRLGDFAANTIVVRMAKLSAPDLEQLKLARFNSLRDYPHLEARLRQRTSPAEAAIALQALLRRDDFDPAARVELFAKLAAHFRQLVEFPSEASEMISDEQYVRNVVDILFRSHAGAVSR